MTTSTNFTICALVLMQTENLHRFDSEGKFEGIVERTTEVGRIEFLAMGEWVLVRSVRTPGRWHGGCWEAMTRAEARALYKGLKEGTDYRARRGKWTPAAEVHTKLLGSVDLPAGREMFSWGDVGYMYTDVDFVAMTCPVMDDGRGGKHAMRPFKLTTPPTPGDPYRRESNRIQFTEVR